MVSKGDTFEKSRRGESLPLMREVAFAEQMTEGEKTGKKILSPSQPIRLTAPSSEGAKNNPTAKRLAVGRRCNRNNIREP